MRNKKKANNIYMGFSYQLQYKKILGIGASSKVAVDVVVLGENERFLYLNEIDHAYTWINGGNIPLNLASSYKSLERVGVKTPDENLIHDSTYDLRLLYPAIALRNVKNFNMYGCKINGKRVPDISGASFYIEDGVVLCLSKTCDSKVAARFGNKKCCVRILDVEKLKSIIDSQIGVSGVLRDCDYTDSFQRNHFLKSIKDSWQSETRIFWAAKNKIEVMLPPGIAEFVEEYKY